METKLFYFTYVYVQATGKNNFPNEYKDIKETNSPYIKDFSSEEIKEIKKKMNDIKEDDTMSIPEVIIELQKHKIKIQSKKHQVNTHLKIIEAFLVLDNDDFKQEEPFSIQDEVDSRQKHIDNIYLMRIEINNNIDSSKNGTFNYSGSIKVLMDKAIGFINNYE